MTDLVVVCGPAASGKSSLAVPLARDLGLPLLAKDAVKEALFDALGTGDGQWSKRMGAATYAIMWAVTPGFPAVVLEANFGAPDAPRLRSLCERPVQVHCTAPRAVLERRWRERPRHRGHADEEYPADRRDQAEPLDLGGPVLVVDTTEPPDVAAVTAWVRGHLGR